MVSCVIDDILMVLSCFAALVTIAFHGLNLQRNKMIMLLLNGSVLTYSTSFKKYGPHHGEDSSEPSIMWALLQISHVHGLKKEKYVTQM